MQTELEKQASALARREGITKAAAIERLQYEARKAEEADTPREND